MVIKIFSFIWKLVLVFLVLLFIASHFSTAINTFAVSYVAQPARSFYAAVCNTAPIPYFEALAVALLLSIPFVIWRYISGRGSLSVLLRAVELCAVGYIITVGIDGAIPKAAPDYTPTDDEIISASEMLAENLNTLAEALPDEFYADYDDVRRAAGKYAREALGVEYTHIPTVKASIFEKLISRMDILAYYSPVTAEVIINGSMPGFIKTSSSMHELMHYFGVTREDDAIYHSYLASLLSEESTTKYSVALSAFVCIGAELYSSNESAYFKIVDNLAPRVKKDLEQRQTVVYKNGEYNRLSAALNDAVISSSDKRGSSSYSLAAGKLVRAVLAN